MRSAVRRGRVIALASVSFMVCVATTMAVVMSAFALRAAPASRGARVEAPRSPVVLDMLRAANTACVQPEAWSPSGGLPCPPYPYQPGDFVYTCAWIESHPAEAEQARVGCESN